MSGDGSDDGARERDPLADLETEYDGTDAFAELDAEADASAGADGAGAFESVDVDPVAVEDVWASLEEADDERPEVSLEGSAESVDGDDHRVPKREYCQRCPFLSDPPEVACTHDGTSIVAVEDADHFRVRNCPMVEGPPPGGER